MRLIVQRVKEASVKVSGKIVSSISKGYLVYVGISVDDNESSIRKSAEKVKNLRVFEDENHKMNLNLKSVDGQLLVISQFTLYGDTKGNNRPSFVKAAKAEIAKPLYDLFVSILKEDFNVETGIFQEDMDILSVNDGPVTIMIEID